LQGHVRFEDHAAGQVAARRKINRSAACRRASSGISAATLGWPAAWWPRRTTRSTSSRCAGNPHASHHGHGNQCRDLAREPLRPDRTAHGSRV
jgi:hypothetical protein